MELGSNFINHIIFFYFLTNYDIAPKTNLFIFLIIVFFFMYVWRGFYNNVIGRQMPMTKTAIIGRTPIAEEIGKTINVLINQRLQNQNTNNVLIREKNMNGKTTNVN